MDSKTHKPSVPLMVRLPADRLELIDKAIANANARLEENHTTPYCTHGLLTRLGLVELLLNDVADTLGRPHGWEATEMMTLLLRHGYDVTDRIT